MRSSSNDKWRGNNVSYHQVQEQTKNNSKANRDTNAANNSSGPDIYCVQ